MSRWDILFRYRGRISRARYWQVTNKLNWALAVVLGIFICGASWLLRATQGGPAFEPLRACLFGASTLLAAAFFWIATAMGAKRCHDRGFSAWWQVLLLVPYGGIVFFFMIGGRRGNRGDNRFGPDPLSRPKFPGRAESP